MSTYIKHSEDDSLTHYGIKGMKWRKGRKSIPIIGDYFERKRIEEQKAKKKAAAAKKAKSDAKAKRRIENTLRNLKSETLYGKPYSKPKVWYKKNKTKHQTGMRGTPQKNISTYNSSTKFKGLNLLDPAYERARLNYTEKTPKKYKRKVTRKH